ncbi:hypothetical protein RA307_29320 [Xanthobacteraceae bacterium Astr-EGSB]|uniref:hypothetical protein n=1 Tax=Astrobacterium formosum TaxID=3069710 RepID=UPI0027B31DAF|nr:hypothetical protein [Xanthobacteraceae bacterium Astr-EGSB]
MKDVAAIRRNIQRCKNLFNCESNEKRRQMLLDLLAEEEAKLAGIITAPPMSRAG